MDQDPKFSRRRRKVDLGSAEGLLKLFLSLPRRLKRVPGKTRYLMRIEGRPDKKQKRMVEVFRCDDGTLDIANKGDLLKLALDASERADYCFVFSINEGHGAGSPNYLKFNYCWRALSEEIITNFQNGSLLAGKALTRVIFGAGARPIPALKDRELDFDPVYKMIEIPGTCRAPIPVLETGYE